jgi:hypothetical protein
VIRPWYRSRLLWFGMPGPWFLVWLGWIFPPRIVTRSGPSGLHQLYAYGSTLMFYSEPGPASPGWDMSVPRMGLDDIVPQGGPWLSWGHVTQPGGMSGPPRVDFFIVRSWLPTAIYLVTWMAAIAGRQLYKDRMMRRAAEIR